MRTVNRSLAAILLLVGSVCPVWAADLTDWLSLDGVAALLTPGELWCFEPAADGSCLFVSVSTGLSGLSAQYSVVEKWDANTILTNQVSGKLTSAGFLCEAQSEYLTNFEVRDLNGVAADAARLVQIRDEIASYQDSSIPEYCYRYTQGDSNDPGRFMQIEFANGKKTGSNLLFEVTKRSNDLPLPALRNP